MAIDNGEIMQVKTKVQLVTVSEAESGQRIDNYLIRIIGNVPKSLVYRILRRGEVRVNKKRAKPMQKIVAGDVVRIPPLHLAPESTTIVPQHIIDRIEQSILYEDNDVLVLNKPAGIAVHNGSGVDYGVIEALRCGRFADEYIELAHRLDKDTSGVLLLGKNAAALRGVQAEMKSEHSRKLYHLLVHGQWDHSISDVKLPLKRKQLGNERVVVEASEAEVIAGDAKTAHTRFRVLQQIRKNHQALTILEAELFTGRTHQIRVHTQSSGHPIVFDGKYGDKDRDKIIANFVKENLPRKQMMLHAHCLDLSQLNESYVFVAEINWHF